MKWIKVNDRFDLPKDKVFFALWKGCFCIAEYDDEECRFYISMSPCICPGSMKVEQDREIKFTHYCICEYPEDY